MREARQGEEAEAAAATAARAEAADARRALATAQGALSVADGLEAQLAAAQERTLTHQQQYEVHPLIVQSLGSSRTALHCVAAGGVLGCCTAVALSDCWRATVVRIAASLLHSAHTEVRNCS